MIMPSSHPRHNIIIMAAGPVVGCFSSFLVFHLYHYCCDP
jgi:hypothetical protein